MEQYSEKTVLHNMRSALEKAWRDYDRNDMRKFNNWYHWYNVWKARLDNDGYETQDQHRLRKHREREQESLDLARRQLCPECGEHLDKHTYLRPTAWEPGEYMCPGNWTSYIPY